MKFKYNARTQTGDLQTGFVEAANREAAFTILAGHDLYVLNIEDAEVRRWYVRLTNLLNRVRREDLMIFTRQFAILLDAKISLGDSLRNIYQQTKSQFLKEAISEVIADVDAGLSLSQSLERHSHIFSNFYVSMVRSAEITGRLEEVMGFLADFLEKEANIVSKIRNALIYPVVVIGLFAVVAGIMVGVVFPQLQPVFAESNVELPYLTSLLLGAGSFIANWWLAILIILAVCAVALLDYLRTDEGKVVRDEIVLRLPVLGNLLTKMYVARFAESTSVLIRGGIPVAQALEIAGHTVGSLPYRDAVHEISESVREGELFSRALEEWSVFFPPLVSQMVAVGESTGKLDALLSRISAFYTREVDNLVSNLVELIQPALMIGLGVLIGLLFAAVLLPLYNLVQAF